MEANGTSSTGTSSSVTFSTVTLPTADLERALAFLSGALGLEVRARYGDLVYLATGSTRIALYSATSLARYAGVDALGVHASVLLSLNLSSPSAVDTAVARGVAAGAQLTRPAGHFDWGGYGACLRDPDGHLWELVHAPA